MGRAHDCTRAMALAAFIAAVVVLCISTSVAAAGPVVEVNISRGIMLDRQISANEEAYYGTRETLLRGSLVLLTASRSDDSSAVRKAYKHKTVYIPCSQHLSKALLSDLTMAPVHGLLVALCDADTHNEETLSVYFSSSTADFPVYFIEDALTGAASASSAAAVEQVLQQHGARTSDNVVLSVGQSPRTTVPQPNLTFPAFTLQGNLAVQPRGKTAGQATRVLLTANIDSFGVAPSTHSVGGASGSAAAVEVYRRQGVASAMATHAYGLTLLLGSTARINYAGTTAWLQERADAEMDRYKLIVTLDDLLPEPSTSGEGKTGSGSTPLFLHVQDTFMRRADGKEVVELAQRVARDHGVELTLQSSRTNYQHYDLRFEHEVFANRQLPAVTFSSHRTHVVDQAFRGARQAVDAQSLAVLTARVNFVNAFVSALLGSSAAPADGGSARGWIGSSSYLDGLLSFAVRSVRFPLAYGGRALESYADALQQHLHQLDTAARTRASGSDVSVSASTTLHRSRVRPTGLVVYGPYEQTLRVFVAKQASVELVILAAVLSVVLAFGLKEFGAAGLRRIVLGG